MPDQTIEGTTAAQPAPASATGKRATRRASPKAGSTTLVMVSALTASATR
jgi:hypothetical protein